MYRLLIIDDEPYIVEWVYELFQQHQELDLDIYKAYSGLEALDLLRRAKIDIVLTDIEMPDMNGLELLAEINRSWPLCQVIFLTAYDEFEYAHIASKGGATYLLKTESDEEIIKAVEKAVNEIDNIIKQEELIRNAKRQMEKMLPIMQREYLIEMAKGSSTSDISQSQFEELGINLNANGSIFLLIGRIDNWFLAKQASDRAKQTAIIQTIIQKFFFPVLKYAYLQLDNSMLVWIIQPQENSKDKIISASLWEKTIVYVKGSLDSIQAQCKKSLETSVSFVIDSKLCTWDILSQRLSSLVKLMNYGGINKSEMALTKIYSNDDNVKQSDHYINCMREVTFWLEKMISLETYLESGQREAFFSLFLAFKDNLIPIIKKHSSLGVEVYFSISLLFLTYINRYESLLEKLTTYSELIRLMNINNSMSYEEAFNTFERVADMIFQYQRDDKGINDSNLISSVHEYIQNNLDKDVSLVKLADQVYLNPAYLSRVYKQITGINLSDYIFNTRMNKSKKMLKETNIKVHEIASAVGYESVAYFIRSFKKNTGMTPQEYRESLII